MVSFTRKNQRLTESLEVGKDLQDSPLKGCFIFCVSSPMCQCMKLNSATTHLKIIWSRQPKIHPPHLCCPASELLFTGKKKISPLDTVPLLRTRQPYYFNKVSSFPSTHIILCQEFYDMLLLCALEKFTSHHLLFFPTLLLPQAQVLH